MHHTDFYVAAAAAAPLLLVAFFAADIGIWRIEALGPRAARFRVGGVLAGVICVLPLVAFNLSMGALAGNRDYWWSSDAILVSETVSFALLTYVGVRRFVDTMDPPETQ